MSSEINVDSDLRMHDYNSSLRYKDQFEKQRIERSFNLRKSSFPKYTSYYLHPSDSNISPVSNESLLEVDNFTDLLISEDPQNIIGISQQMISLESSSKNALRTIACSEKVEKILIDKLSADININKTSEQLIIAILQIIRSIIPFSTQEMLNMYCDDGLFSIIVNFLPCNSVDVQIASAILINIFCEFSSYGRDTIICFGIHINLIHIICSQFNSDNETFCVELSAALFSIYRNEGPMEESAVIESLEPLKNLLAINSAAVVKYALGSYVELLNKFHNIADKLFDLNIFLAIKPMLDNSVLEDVTLRLIGNMTFSSPNKVKYMLDNGLYPILVRKMTESNFAVDAFWVLSNLIESDPNCVENYFGNESVFNALQIAYNAGYALKIEISFCVATFIVNIGVKDFSQILDGRFANLIVEVLACERDTYEIRFIDAILKILLCSEIEVAKQFAFLLVESDIKSQFNDISQYPKIISERLNCLFANLSELTSNNV